MSASFLSVAHPSSRLTIGTIAFALLSVGITAPVSGGADVSSTDTTMNRWVKVPTTAVSGREGDRLPGWSTMADFPVNIASRQVTNGWGAFEIFNEGGSIRGVFIPVGRYVLVNADDTLHAIWSSGQLMPKC